MRSAKATGMLFSPNEEPTPSCGTPSMNTFTCLPLKPSTITFMSEPTPPLWRSFSPGALASASASVLVVLRMARASTATALYDEFFTRLTPPATTLTSPRLTAAGRNLTSSLSRWPRLSSTVCSARS